MSKSGFTKISKSNFLPLAVALFILFAAAAAVYSWQAARFDGLARENIESLNALLGNQIKREALLLEALSDFLIEEDEEVRRAWLDKDREALLSQTLPLFDTLRSKYKITHFYFIDLEGICFLRVHDPAAYADPINRFVLKQSMAARAPAYGVELGPLGTLTLRSVYPWHINNKIEGYIELGEELSRITPELKKILGVELIFIIDKSFLNKEGWERSLRAKDKTGDWERFKDFVIIEDTFGGTTGPQIDACLKGSYKRQGSAIFKLIKNERFYWGGSTPLKDAAGKELGSIVVFKDVSQQENSFKRFFIVLGAIYIIGSLVLFFILKSKKEKDISSFERIVSGK